jgi:uncharacterized protein (TIGR00730 family)
MERICVFCGSSRGSRPKYRAAAVEMGRELVRRSIGLVYGGGNVGLMGVIADAVLRAGGEAQGVIPENLMALEVGHKGLTKLHVVRSMHERKGLMADLSDAFVAMPGGFGTLEEFCEVLTWSQLGLHAKPYGMLNVLGFYTPLLRMFHHAVDERFLKPENRALVLARESPVELLRHWRSGVRHTLRNGWIGRRGRAEVSSEGILVPICPKKHSKYTLEIRHYLCKNRSARILGCCDSCKLRILRHRSFPDFLPKSNRHQHRFPVALPHLL